MRFKYGYAYEKFLMALFSMAEGPESIQERIAIAARGFIRLKAEQLPEEIRHTYEETWARLTSQKPVGGEGSIMATVADMSTEEAVGIAQKIVSMAGVIIRERIESLTEN